MSTRFVEGKGQCITKAEAEERVGRDWAKVVKVEGGWRFFETLADYRTWKAPPAAVSPSIEGVDDAFEAADALYVYLSENYEGELDPRYHALCLLSADPIRYSPSPLGVSLDPDNPFVPFLDACPFGFERLLADLFAFMDSRG